jgi:hypothetical protein
MSNLGVSEVVAIVREQETLPAKVAVLRSNDSIPLRRLLRMAYDPRVKWLLPEGDPPYKPLPIHEQIGSEMMFHKEARTLYIFVEGFEERSNIRPLRREMKFIELLENLHPADARLLLEAKKRSIPGLQPEVVQAAFPDLIA